MIIRTFLIAMVLAAFSTSSIAETFTVHGGGWSHHIDSSDYDYNSNHRLIAGEYRDWIGGYFRNSFDEDSFFIGHRFNKQLGDIRLSIMPGATYGYRHCTKPKDLDGNDRRVCPVVVPSATYTKYQVKPTVSLMGTAVVLTIELDLDSEIFGNK
ncbi:hypothetical protein [Hahella ganghwensis]|uniref:hypothetical protein n=1 Tax=Hahella ganghwensis TaxID=286420 RepID=UPI0003797619|nr:hypothetical protein [Hahella ganghwensis]